MRATLAERPTSRSPGPIRTIGFWSAVLTTLFAVAFTLAFAGDAILAPPSGPWQGVDAFAASFSSIRMALLLVPSILLAPCFVALIACLHEVAPPARRVWSRIGLALAIIYAVVATINYTVQLVVVRGNIHATYNQALALLVMDNPRSLFWGLAIICYNVYMAAAALFVVPTLGNSALERWVKGLFVVNALTSLVAGINYFITLDNLQPLGLVASGVWCLAFPAATILLAVRFRRPGR